MNKPREPIMNCDLCNTDYPESHLLSVGMVMWTGVQKMEMFLCEECAQKTSNALKKRKEHRVTMGIKEVREVRDNPRNTQFSGFAKLLMDELLTHFGDFEDMERIITQRAYDLVGYTLDNVITTYIPSILDMTKWPDHD